MIIDLFCSPAIGVLEIIAEVLGLSAVLVEVRVFHQLTVDDRFSAPLTPLEELAGEEVDHGQTGKDKHEDDR